MTTTATVTAATPFSIDSITLSGIWMDLVMEGDKPFYATEGSFTRDNVRYRGEFIKDALVADGQQIIPDIAIESDVWLRSYTRKGGKTRTQVLTKPGKGYRLSHVKIVLDYDDAGKQIVRDGGELACHIYTKRGSVPEIVDVEETPNAMPGVRRIAWNPDAIRALAARRSAVVAPVVPK